MKLMKNSWLLGSALLLGGCGSSQRTSSGSKGLGFFACTAFRGSDRGAMP